MIKIRKILRTKLFVLSFLAITGLAFSGCGNGTGQGDVQYLVITGDSLSVGTQPDANGDNMTTDRGYGETLYQLLLPFFPNLELVKLGCLNSPGETTVTMIEGGSCEYPDGKSQLDTIKEFINENGSNIALLTIDIGVNDLLQSGCIDFGPPLDVDVMCVQDFLENVLPSRLTFIMSELFQLQTEFGFPIFGLNYYNPYVVIYFQVYPTVAAGIAEKIQNDPEIIGPIQTECAMACMTIDPEDPCLVQCVTEAVGELVAQEAPAETVQVVQDLGIDALFMAFNFQVLQGVYDIFSFPVVDIGGAFMSSDFTLVPAPPPFAPITMAPVNALAACELTFMCPDQNIHASDAGYQLMGQTVFELYNSLFPQ